MFKLRTGRSRSNNPRHLDEGGFGRSWRPRSISRVLKSMSSWALASCSYDCCVLSVFVRTRIGIPAIYTISIWSVTTQEWTKAYFLGFATRHIHPCGSMTTIGTVTNVQTLLDAQLILSWMMTGNARWEQWVQNRTDRKSCLRPSCCTKG